MCRSQLPTEYARKRPAFTVLFLALAHARPTVGHLGHQCKRAPLMARSVAEPHDLWLGIAMGLPWLDRCAAVPASGVVSKMLPINVFWPWQLPGTLGNARDTKSQSGQNRQDQHSRCSPLSLCSPAAEGCEQREPKGPNGPMLSGCPCSRRSTGFRHEKQRPGVFHLQRNGRRVTVRHAISDSPKSEGRAHAMAPQEQRPQKERIASPLRRPSAFAFLGQ